MNDQPEKPAAANGAAGTDPRTEWHRIASKAAGGRAGAPQDDPTSEAPWPEPPNDAEEPPGIGEYPEAAPEEAAARSASGESPPVPTAAPPSQAAPLLDGMEEIVGASQATVIAKVTEKCENLQESIEGLNRSVDALAAETRNVREAVTSQDALPIVEAVADLKRTMTALDGKLERTATAFNDRFERTATAFHGDLHRARRAARRSVRWIALAVGTPLVPGLAALGILVQIYFEPIETHDPTQGWKDYVWDNHGKQIQRCALQASGAGKNLECKVIVRPPRN